MSLLKIFCDIADIKTIKNFNKKEIVKGFTTNPSLMRKAGAKDYLYYCKRILKICKKKPISFEVFADNFSEMEKQALKINSWGKNVYVKIPVINSKGHFMGRLIKSLSKKKIKLNITAVYKISHVIKILKNLDKNTKSIISIFAGRIGDSGIDPVPIMKMAVLISKKYKNVSILWASTREAYNYTQAKQLGCDIITMPPKIINVIENFGSSLDQFTKNTVITFIKDSKKSNFKIKI